MSTFEPPTSEAEVIDAIQHLADVALGSSEVCFALATFSQVQDCAHALTLVAQALEEAGTKAASLARALDE